MRTDRLGGTWWRIDAEHPDTWTWDGFSEPRHRFDPPSGRFRVRYAANGPVAAARERFGAKTISSADGHLLLVELTADTPALHLTRQVNLDPLGLDDRINTGRLDRRETGGDALLDTSQALADAVHDWWDGSPPAIVYRTRTMPDARSVAFFAHSNVSAVRTRPLREAQRLLAVLVARHGFVVPGAWLG